MRWPQRTTITTVEDNEIEIASAIGVGRTDVIAIRSEWKQYLEHSALGRAIRHVPRHPRRGEKSRGTQEDAKKKTAKKAAKSKTTKKRGAKKASKKKAKKKSAKKATKKKAAKKTTRKKSSKKAAKKSTKKKASKKAAKKKATSAQAREEAGAKAKLAPKNEPAARRAVRTRNTVASRLLGRGAWTGGESPPVASATSARAAMLKKLRQSADQTGVAR